MLECRVESDEQGRLRIYQKLQLANISTGVALLNEHWCRTLTEAAPVEQPAEGQPFLDESAQEALLAAAARGEGPFGLREGTLSLTFPLTGASLAHYLASLSRQAASEDCEWLAHAAGSLLAPLSELVVCDGSVELRYAPDESGVLRFDSERASRAYDPALADFLSANGVALPLRYVAGD